VLRKLVCWYLSSLENILRKTWVPAFARMTTRGATCSFFSFLPTQESMSSVFFLFSLFFCTSVYASPLLVAVLMVKNEEPSMQMTLQPLVDAGIKDFLIYDTGSSDNTINVTKQFFIENNISNFLIVQGEWIDFSSSRNRALELAERYFPHATFVLMLDAEWILHNGSDLLKFCKQQQHNRFAVLYYIRLLHPEIDFYHARLIRCGCNIRFVGKVHELPDSDVQGKVPSHIYFQLSPTHYGIEKTHARWIRDRDLLLQEFQENPHRARTVYYLAQTCACLHDWPAAVQWFDKRVHMQGWDEERFLACIFLAHAYFMVGDYKKMIVTYLQAFEMRPTRAESLIRLAHYFFTAQCSELAYIFARYAVMMPYPYKDSSPIEKKLYDFDRYNMVSILAGKHQEFLLGKEATLQALHVHPELEYLQNNLKYYESMLSQIKEHW
jgi:glycosyltransferase involved in cell wall biosynthesis